MEDGEGGGFRMGKKSTVKDGEVDYRTKAGTAWSHSFLNQKPWHPLSYPNQRRKWIAEQTHAQKERRAEEVAREYAQEQEFLRQTALINKKEKERLEMMRAVSFMYVKPPGYDPESAKEAEISSQKKKTDGENSSQAPGASSSKQVEGAPPAVEKKKSRPKDVFGRVLPTEEQFEVLKNAPKLDTGVAGRAKPFGVEIRNVKCLRCGNFGHQSGDRDCPLKNAITANEENRLKRDDPLTAILAQTDSVEPLKWELKQAPGMSPPHGGFDRDDPNQQIVAGEVFDEYGGFLVDASGMPDLLTKFPGKSKKSKKRRKSSTTHKLKGRESSSSDDDDDGDDRRRRSSRGHEKKKKKEKRKHRESSSSESLESKHSRSRNESQRRRRHRHHRHHSRQSDDSMSEHEEHPRAGDRHGDRHRRDTSASKR